MSRSAIKMTETLMLRRIDPVDMLRRYLTGEFKKVEIPKDKVKLSSAFVNLNQRIGTDQTSRIYRFSDKINSGQLIVTTNHNNYQYHKDISEGGKVDKLKSYCFWCRREIKGKPIGIVVSMEINSATNEAVFYIEDDYDNFACAFAGLKRFNGCHHMYRDPKYMDAEQLLHCLYYRMYPDKIGTRIKEALDWRLLNINGGPLSNEEYDSDQIEYVEMPNVILPPSKRQYVKLTLPIKK